MKIYILALIMSFGFQSKAQFVNYFRAHLGPKVEIYKSSSNQHINMQSQIGAGFGLFVGHEFSDNVNLDLGLVRNDYSAKFNLEYTEASNGETYKVFDGYIFPSLVTYQISALPIFHFLITPQTSMYISAGLQIFLTKKLDRNQPETIYEDYIKADGTVINSHEMLVYDNTSEPGNFIARTDVGFWFQLTKELRFDASLQARGSTLPISSFKVQYSDSNHEPINSTITSNGVGFSLNLGFKYMLSE